MLPFVRAGLVEDVSDIWSDTGWVDGNLTEGMSHAKKPMTIGGKQWGIPYTYYQWGVYYRKDIFENLATDDIRNAADILEEVYKKTNSMDGFVSLEVDPFLANDFEKTINEAKKLWDKVDRKNLMIKIPGTKEGIMATKHLLEEGINVNVTLLFSFDSYKKTLEAFIESKNKNILTKTMLTVL